MINSKNAPLPAFVHKSSIIFFLESEKYFLKSVWNGYKHQKYAPVTLRPFSHSHLMHHTGERLKYDNYGQIPSSNISINAFKRLIGDDLKDRKNFKCLPSHSHR